MAASGRQRLGRALEVALDEGQAGAAVTARAVTAAGYVLERAGAAAHRFDHFTIGDTAADAEDHRTGVPSLFEPGRTLPDFESRFQVVSCTSRKKRRAFAEVAAATASNPTPRTPATASATSRT